MTGIAAIVAVHALALTGSCAVEEVTEQDEV